MPEERTLDYVNRPEGEMDMMIGFFLMNGICVAFFLLFGLCVIFSCLRQRPRIFRREQKPQRKHANVTPPPPKFRTLVTKALRTGAFDRLRTASEDLEAPVEKKQLRVDQDGSKNLRLSIDIHDTAAVRDINGALWRTPLPSTPSTADLLGSQKETRASNLDRDASKSSATERL
ncbi:unnamed protein product [Heligmosomoides polygyrus]|uniref:Uncharacterized protein n=1 Tax=Heligmosomoides polygyrus TaxID=6339 RepID=A0A183FLC8_HELPZ|nr:unnamed protein product [Heligmosomoides polygyrus]